MKRPDYLLNSREAAEAAGLSYDGLIKAIQSGRIKRFVKIGNRNFFFPADMAAYRERREARQHAR